MHGPFKIKGPETGEEGNDKDKVCFAGVRNIFLHGGLHFSSRTP